MSTNFKNIESIIKPILDKTGDARDLAKALTRAELLAVWQDLVAYEASSGSGGGAIDITWSNFLLAIGSATLTPNATYHINDLLSVTEHFYFKAIDVDKIDPEGIYYPAGINGITNTPAVKVVLSCDQNGNVDGNIFDYFYEPIYNNKWYGWPGGQLGDTNSQRRWFDQMVGLNANYFGNVVKRNATFSGDPITSVQGSTFEYLDRGYNFTGTSVTIEYCSFDYSYNYGFNCANVVTLKNCKFGSANHAVGNNVDLYNVQTTAKSGTHRFPDSSVTSDGIVGGRGCSAEFETVIDLGGGSTLDLSAYPLCKTYHITNVDAGGLTNITGWNVSENHGAEITIEGSLGVNLLTGNIMSSTNTSVTSGGAFATVNEWAKLFLHNNGNAYLIDYL